MSGGGSKALRILRRSALLGRNLLAALRGGKRGVGYIGLVPDVGIHNLGDAIMLSVFEREMAPARLYPSMLYRSIEHRVWRAACRRTFSACILGGGTLLFWRHFYDYLSEALDAGVPCYVLGTGVNSPEFWREYDPAFLFSPERSVEALRACRFVGVRGPLSQRILQEAGLEGAEVVGDPALLLAGDGPPPAPAEERVLGVNIGTSWDNVWGGDEERPMAEVAAAANALATEGWSVRFYCVWPEDRPAVEKVRARVSAGNVSVAEHYLSAEDFMADVGRCSAFVGMKLHATALALCAGVPSLMIDYRPKCLDFMASLGLEDLTIRLDEIEATPLARMLSSLPERRVEIHERYWPRLLAMKTALRERLAMVKGELSSAGRE